MSDRKQSCLPIDFKSVSNSRVFQHFTVIFALWSSRHSPGDFLYVSGIFLSIPISFCTFISLTSWSVNVIWQKSYQIFPLTSQREALECCLCCFFFVLFFFCNGRRTLPGILRDKRTHHYIIMIL